MGATGERSSAVEKGLPIVSRQIPDGAGKPIGAELAATDEIMTRN